MSASDEPEAWIEIVDRTESRVRGRADRSGGTRTWIVVALVAAAVVIAWMVARAPTTGLDDVADDLVAPTSTTLTDGIGTANGGSIVAGQSDAGVAGDLGELDTTLADYRLFASRSSELIEIDLATEEVTTHPVAGRLVGFFDGRLLLIDPADGVVAVPADDPESEPETILPVEPDGAEVRSAVIDDDGVLHLTIVEPSADPFRSTMVRLDLSTGGEERVDVPSLASMGLVEVPGGGVFELTADGFRPLTDASVRFFGFANILVERCDDPDQCRRFWIQRSTGVRIFNPLPGLQVGYVLGRTGRVVVGVDPGRVGYFDVRLAADIAIEDPYRDLDHPLFVVEDLTADDRFLAVVAGDTGSDVVIHDLDTRDEVRFELGRSSPLSKLLFVPRADGP